MAVSESSLTIAVRNVAHRGDTDVFPYPLENHWFHDSEAKVVTLLQELDGNFDAWLSNYPVTFQTSLTSVGYNGFRAATQVDPVWNVYLLALVIDIAGDIEAARIPANRNIVYSYRFDPSGERHTLFDSDLGWASFHKEALARAESFEVVVSTDISDYYPRIYHHRLENALSQATQNSETVRRVMEILKRLSGGTSYGLPVGGNAARLLALGGHRKSGQ